MCGRVSCRSAAWAGVLDRWVGVLELELAAPLQATPLLLLFSRRPVRTARVMAKVSSGQLCQVMTTPQALDEPTDGLFGRAGDGGWTKHQRVFQWRRSRTDSGWSGGFN